MAAIAAYRHLLRAARIAFEGMYRPYTPYDLLSGHI